MGYRKIKNLHKDLTILEICKNVWALEKLHGTSAHIAWKDNQLSFFSGEQSKDFVKLFDHDLLKEGFERLGCYDVKVYGEAYGGKCQGMRDTYGPDFKFAAFEVQIDGSVLSVAKGNKVATELGFEFVHHVFGPATKEFVNEQRDADSVQAIRNGMGRGKIREGIVTRPPVELRLNNGKLLIAKHKRPEFRESKSPKPLDPEKQKRLSKAKEIAEEYVVDMRLEHVIAQFLRGKDDDYELSMADTGHICRFMVDDVKEEEGDMIDWSNEVQKAIGRRAAFLFKKRLMSI